MFSGDLEIYWVQLAEAVRVGWVLRRCGNRGGDKNMGFNSCSACSEWDLQPTEKRSFCEFLMSRPMGRRAVCLMPVALCCVLAAWC